MVPHPKAQRTIPVPTPPRARSTSLFPVSPHIPIVNETSAGGIIVDHSSSAPRVAVIARRNRAGRLEWCLPKGHLEGNETPEQAAVREIEEETGIQGVVVKHIGTIDYWFSGSVHRVHKVVHHFLLTATGGTLSVENDPDSEVEEVAWIAISDLPNRLVYPNERRLATAIRDDYASRRASMDGL